MLVAVQVWVKLLESRYRRPLTGFIPSKRCDHLLFHCGRPNERVALGPTPRPAFSDHSLAAFLVWTEDVNYLVERNGVGNSTADRVDSDLAELRQRCPP